MDFHLINKYASECGYTPTYVNFFAKFLFVAQVALVCIDDVLVTIVTGWCWTGQVPHHSSELGNLIIVGMGENQKGEFANKIEDMRKLEKIRP